MNKNWKSHFEIENKELSRPAATLTKALSLIYQSYLIDKTAVDLGCGAGADTYALLKSGWNVLAIDNSQDAIDKISDKTSGFDDLPLKLKLSSFESLKSLPKVNLVNATFSLPFCRPEKFFDFWKLIEESINTEGYFAGHFFGTDDDWSVKKEMTFLDRAAVEKLFENFQVGVIKEVNEVGKTVANTQKHWHVFHVVARKKA